MRGHTLVELTFVLLLVGVAVSSVAPSAVRARDRAAVAAAREALIGLLAEARQAAIESGTASVRVLADSVRIESGTGGTLVRRLPLAADFGVAVALPGRAGETELHFDALGLGRMASQTLVLTRGEARATLIVSGYGRVRRS